jgi:hypothetical protein
MPQDAVDLARCPEDGAILVIGTTPGPKGWGSVVGDCPMCRQRVSVARTDDPKLLSYRDWTSDEVFALFREYNKTRLVKCPGDGTSLEATEEPAGGSPLVGAKDRVLHCPRCNRETRQRISV